MNKVTRTLLVLAFSLAAWPAQAQMTTGGITGRVTDEQGAAMPGVLIQATSKETGFTRVDVSDASGTYRLAALPVGPYDLTAELAGFQSFQRKAIVINIATTVPLDIRMQVAALSETVTVSAAAPLISTRSSSVGEVVDLARIEGLPLNGRQFANLAATVPGVGLGLHSDVSKTAQYTPQISGGNGRNVNYIVDGGDNNDDTVGGLLQQYPLEAIQEFALTTQRFDAEYGRSNGAVLNVVTKSGTNNLHGSWFTLFRDDAMNAQTFTEKINNIDKQAYKRYQYGGSVGGPIVQNKAHFFGAYERTQQDTKQAVNTRGLFAGDGVFGVPFRENLYTLKATATPMADHYVSLRYARDHNSQPSGASPLTAYSAWATTTNAFDSFNANHNWVLGQSTLNELVFQYSRFANETPIGTEGPSYVFPSGVRGGANTNAPQFTKQTKWQYRDDLSWNASGFGVAHELKAGLNWIHEPQLTSLTGQGKNIIFTLAGEDLNGPVAAVFQTSGNTTSTIPIDLYGMYVQDNWRVANRLTLNLGVRWDYVNGFPIDQSSSANFLAVQAAGATGRFAGTLLEDFGSNPRPDKDNIQPRLGAVYDLRGNGKDVVRAGWGIYTDFGYTNSNALTASFDQSGNGIIFTAGPAARLLKADGTEFHVTDPLSTIAALNAADPNAAPRSGEIVSPLLEQPYTRQTNLGWSHELNGATAISADFVRVEGRDLNLRVRPNALVNGTRILAGVDVQPSDNNFRVAISKGESLYNGLILALRRRMSHGVDMNASYTLAKATSDVGTAYDELAQNLLQDVTEPFSSEQQAPSSRTDARHRVSISAIIALPSDIRVASIFSYRSALPIHTIEGIDLNRDGNTNDSTLVAYRYTGLNADGTATFEEAGPCETVNCSRRAPFSQLNLRVSRSFRLSRAARIEAIAEVFNLFDAKNPFIGATGGTTRVSRTGVPLAAFMRPTAFAGDVNQPEQRIGQIGLRLTF